MKVTNKYVFFWRGIFGNWYPTPNGITANIEGKVISVPTSEHLFMYLKAIYFKDYDTAEKILQTPSPKEAKNLGRQVKNFSEEKWILWRENAMMTALKFRAAWDETFIHELCKPEYFEKTFVEASPYDRIWGIGIGEEDCYDGMDFLGLNLLGKLLTQLRDTLVNKTKRVD